MADPLEIDFLDPETNACPYAAYARLRDEAPVWRDEATGMYVLTRYDDVRAVLLDSKRFTNEIGSGATKKEVALRGAGAPGAAATAARAERLRRLYEDRGWLPAPSLDTRDDPNHMEMRRLFDFAFRPAAIRALDPFVEELAARLLEPILAAGRAEWVSQFAVPLPLYVIGRQVGVPDEDLPQIKAWTDAYVRRMSLTQTEEEALWSAEQEIEAQHYFQRRIEELRREPDESLLSVLVNREIPEWGRTLTDNELHAELMTDLFVGGAETTTNAISAGVRILIERPELFERLKARPHEHLATFVEEVLRLESPVQALMRRAVVDVELHGVTIPAGATVTVRYGAANRDARRFAQPDALDLERANAHRHLAFGVGTHHCLGAPLARRELHFAFKALVERVDRLWFVAGANDFAYHQNYFLRSLKELHVGLEPASR